MPHLFGISYRFKENLMLVLEKDTILVDGPRMPYPNRKMIIHMALNITLIIILL